MAYTLTQARPLLNAAELELFEQSRAEPVKQLTGARLAGAIKRTRTLRDKYRDLYQRQTVAVRTSTPGAVTGDDNERTQRKADILQEVLGRFEARVEQLEAKEQRQAPQTSRPATTVKGKPAAASKVAKTAPQTTTSTRGAKTGDDAKANAEKGSPRALAKTGAANGSGAAPVHVALDEAVLNRHATRSSKAPSDKAPTANGKAHAPLAHAPTDLVPAALRGNPLKQAPSNIAIHAHQGANARRAQGKRDSR